MFRKIDMLNRFDPKYFLWYQDDDFLNQQLYHNKGITPFVFQLQVKVPLIVSNAEVKHQYSSTHDQLNEKWIKKTTDKEKKNILKKMEGISY